MMRGFLATAAVALVMAMPASAATVVAFTSINDDGRVAASEEGAGVTGFDLGRSLGLVPNVGGTYNSRDWSLDDTKLSALANNDALFWGFSSTVGYNLTSLSFGYDRSPTGPASIAVDLFIGGVFQGEIFRDETFSATNGTQRTATIDLSSFDDVSNAFFRLSGWNATGSTGTFDIENRTALDGRGIVVSGEVAAVPLPAALPMLLGALGLLGVARRRA